METFIFNFDKHTNLIDSFLESAALAYKHSEIKSMEWFYWKFKDNPFGESILACATENNKIVGCVAFGIQDFILNGNIIKGVLSFDTFVNPDYQGKGLFSTLLNLAEYHSKKKKIDFMLNFPNFKSLKGFLKNGWKQNLNAEYWIKGSTLLSIPILFKHLNNSFNPDESNFSKIHPPKSFSQNLNNKKLTSVINLDYLKWRFFTFPVGKYVIIDTQACYSILRMGNRGKIREAQVLFINIKNESKFKFSNFINECKLKSNYDLISFPISKYNPIRKYLKKSFFLKVPNQTNICYKILNKELITDSDVKHLSICAINYHTY